MSMFPEYEERFIKMYPEEAHVLNKPFNIGNETFILYGENNAPPHRGVLCKVELSEKIRKDDKMSVHRGNPILFWSVYQPGSLKAAMDIPKYLSLISK